MGELTEAELSEFTPIQSRRVETLQEVDRRLDWLLLSVRTCKAANTGKPFEQALSPLTDTLVEYRAASESLEDPDHEVAQPEGARSG